MSTEKLLHRDTGWSSLQRPTFSPGLLLEDEDLNVGVSYTRDLMRLALKSLFGCGVICGLKVTVTPTCQDRKRKIELQKGVALDCLGNLIEVSKPWSYEYDTGCEDPPPAIWVVLCYYEKCCRPKDVTCSSDEESQSMATRIRAGYEVKLLKSPPACGCRCRTPDDDQPTTQPTHGCCHGYAASQTAQTPQAAPTGQGAQTAQGTAPAQPAPADPCACYKAHYEGVCECDCGCECVVLAKLVDPATIIEQDGTRTVAIDVAMVRRVRPALYGYLDCRCPPQPRGQIAAGTAPAGGRP